MKIDPVGLSELAMWNQWQEVVRLSLPNFCANRIYVEQLSPTQEEFEAVAEHVAAHHPHHPEGKTLDARFGGLVRNTRALGPVTRMWLDANVELDFLARHLPMGCLRILDIGAGYGRLAAVVDAMKPPYVNVYYCVDAVPISTRLCREYTAGHRALVQVFSLQEFAAVADGLHPDLAINIHSWNECNLSQIARWLDVLREMEVPWLFTVSHPDAQAYLSYDLKSWKDLLLKEYDLVAEEFIGLGKCPHALWRRR